MGTKCSLEIMFIMSKLKVKTANTDVEAVFEDVLDVLEPTSFERFLKVWHDMGGRYNMVLDWRWQGGRWQGARGVENRAANLNSIKKALLDQFGLELISTNMSIEMLIIEKAQ
jgi:uncharacterized protein (TIGR03435 family)